MKDLKSFSTYLKATCLREMTIEYVAILKSSDIPLVKLVIERRVYPDIKEEEAIEITMVGLNIFLTSIENGTCYEEAKKGIVLWKENKMPIKGISRDEINPSDLVQIFAAQKKALLKFLPSFCNNLAEALVIATELDSYYISVEGDAVKMLFDIQKETEMRLKETKEKLERKALELTRSNTELEQFAYVASHDLQEPLRTVSSYLQLLASRYKGKLDGEADEFINYAVDGSSRMRQLISSLLEYSRINRVKPFEKVNLPYTLNEILADLSDQVKSTGAVFKFENLPDIYADEVLIGQLFQNLIGNALKFKSDRKPEIIISAEKQNGFYLFSVKDNGIGIPKEYWEKIFIIFKRLNHRETYPGTGIGLSICKKIVERHGGTIWVESEPGKGSTFYFTIKRTADKKVSHKIKANAEYNEHIAD